MNDENEMINLQKKVQVFFERQIKIHISFKEGYWKRGLIKEVSAEFFMLDERLEGLMPVFYTEIVSITPYTPKKEGVI